MIAIGNALGEFDNTVTSGIISCIGRPVQAGGETSQTERLVDLLQTDAAINPGNSGGPLVNIEGQIIGVNTAVAGGAENIGFAIPINQAKSGISSIERTGRLEKPFLGVRFIELSKEIAEANSLPVHEGAWLVSGGGQPAVLPDSPAAKAGFQEGDIITQVGGEKVTRKRSLTSIIGSHQVGDTVALVVRRGDKTETFTVTLSSLSAD